MKTFKILVVLFLAGFLFACEKEVVNETIKQDVTFNISEALSLKSDGALRCPTDGEGNLLTPTIAEVIIDGVTYYPDVFYLNGRLYSQAIQLAVPDMESQEYTITKFILWSAHPDDGGDPIMATPMDDSEFAEYVTEALALSFTVTAFEKAQVNIDVLCFTPAVYEGFGFNWFYIQQIVVREISFFGDLCIKDKDDYDFEGSVYRDVFGEGLNGYVFDLPALFEIRVKKDGVAHGTFSNIDPVPFKAPLLVRYGDNIGVVETFDFELWVYVRVGDNVVPVHFKTWTIMDDEIIENTTANGVVEFIIGNCVVNYPQGTLILPPYQNLPEEATVNIQFDLNAGGYWKMQVGALNPVGSYDFPPVGSTWYLGWCGDPTKTIPAGSKVFKIFSSMNSANWPAVPVTLEALAKVNWLFNNLQSFGYPSLTGMFVEQGDLPENAEKARDLQHAIWLTLGYTQAQFPAVAQGGGTASAKAIEMYTAASSKGNFKPLPGGYAAVLMLDKDNLANWQLIFTIVDP